MPSALATTLAEHTTEAKAALVGLGILSAVLIMRDSPALSDDDRHNVGKAMVGMAGFGALLWGACSYGKLGWCNGLGL